jgi:hypothetical protein
MTAVARKAGQLAATAVQKVRSGVSWLCGWLLTSRVAKVVGVCGVAAVAFHLGGPALAGTVGGLALALPILLADLPGCLLTLFGS